MSWDIEERKSKNAIIALMFIQICFEGLSKSLNDFISPPHLIVINRLVIVKLRQGSGKDRQGMAKGEIHHYVTWDSYREST